MRKKKGKQKVLLYTIRNQKKLIRNAKKRVKKSAPGCSGNTIVVDDFLGSDYNRVIRHLNNKNFHPKKKFQRGEAYQRIEIPEVFSISENAENVIKLLNA